MVAYVYLVVLTRLDCCIMSGNGIFHALSSFIKLFFEFLGICNERDVLLHTCTRFEQ